MIVIGQHHRYVLVPGCSMVLVFISMISTKLNYNDVSMHTAHGTEREMYSTGKGRQHMYAACMPCAILL